MRIPPRLVTALWIAGWMAATAGSLALTRPARAPIHVDEVYWIGGTYYYYLAFHERNWSHPDWRLSSARESPQLARYVIGARLALAGQHVVDRQMIGCFWLMFRAPDSLFQTYRGRDLYLESIGRVTLADCAKAPLGGPGVTRKQDLLPLSRQAILVCGIMASLIVFFFGASIADRPTGFIASQLLLLHPVAVDAIGHAMADGVAMMFTIAAAFAAWVFYRRMADPAPVSPRQATLLVLLNGTLLGLACGAKMNSLVVVFLFVAGALGATALAWRRGDIGRVRSSAALAVATGVVTLIIFSVINPAVMIDPVEGLPAMRTFAKLFLDFLQIVIPDYALVTLPAKLKAVVDINLGPVLFVLIAAFSWLVAIRRPRDGIWFIGVWWLIALLAVTLWIPFEWPRYALPVTLPSVLFLAYAITASTRMLTERFRAR